MPVRNQFNSDAEFSVALRDYFAGQVLGQLIGWCQTDDGWVAENAYQLADAMLAAREVTP